MSGAVTEILVAYGTVTLAVTGLAAPIASRIWKRNEAHRQLVLETTIATTVNAAVSAQRKEITDHVNDAVNDLVEETTRRFDKNDQATEKAASAASSSADRLTRIEAQFGHNGGGLREAVNNIASTVSSVATAQDGITARFEDHLQQSSEDRARLSRVEQTLMDRGTSG